MTSFYVKTIPGRGAGVPRRIPHKIRLVHETIEGGGSDWCDHCGEFDAPASKAFRARLMSRFAIALANANARRSPCLARRSVKLTTVVTLVTTTSFKALVGAQWLSLMR